MPKTMNEEKVRAALARLRAERAEIAEYAAELEGKLEKAPKQEDFDKLRGQLRGDRHRAAFEKACDEAGVRKDARGDLYDVLKLQADADEPDVKAISKAVEKGLESRAWAKEAAAAATKETAAAAKLPAGEGAGRSAPPGNPIEGAMTVSRSDLGNHEFMSKNQAKVSAAAAAGLLTIA